MTAADEYQRVILAHQRIPLFGASLLGQRCTGCDDLYGESDGPNSPRHAAHVAQALAADPGVRAAVERGDDLVKRAIRTLLPGLQVARYSERWAPNSPAVKAFDILAEHSGYEPYPHAEQDAREAHVSTEYARSRGMVTVAEMETAIEAAKREALERAALAIEAECGAANWALTFRNGLRHAVQIIVQDLMPRKDGE